MKLPEPVVNGLGSGSPYVLLAGCVVHVASRLLIVSVPVPALAANPVPPLNAASIEYVPAGVPVGSAYVTDAFPALTVPDVVETPMVVAPCLTVNVTVPTLTGE